MAEPVLGAEPVVRARAFRGAWAALTMEGWVGRELRSTLPALTGSCREAAGRLMRSLEPG